MHEKEIRIKERRSVEAMKKNYMGGTGSKFGVIVRNLGTKIWSQSSAMMDYSTLIDPYELPEDGGDAYDNTTVHEWSEESTSRVIGWVFDGLSRGMHLEIKYIDDNKTLDVYYKGDTVYRETYGDLDAFVPGEWEALIDRLYKTASKLEVERKRGLEEENVAAAKKSSEGFLQKLRSRWGF